MQLGVMAYTYVGEWNETTSIKAIEEAARAGFDFIEIPMVNAYAINASLLKRQLADAGIGFQGSLVLPDYAHMPSKPNEAKKLLLTALDKIEEMGGNALTGVLYASPGQFTLEPPTAAEREICIQVLGEVAADAQKRGFTLALEPINRYETYVYNVVEDLLPAINKIGLPNVGIHLDTYHMNIDEHGFYNATKLAGERLFYVHVSESDRGTLGEGNVHWDDFFRALKEINYSGPLALESFTPAVSEMIAVCCIWRPAKYPIEEMVSRGNDFLKAKCKQYGLV